MRVGKFLELAKRFPEDAELHLDGQWPYVEVKGQGYFDLDYPDSKLPWLPQPLTKLELIMRQRQLLSEAIEIQKTEPHTAQRLRHQAAKLDEEIAKAH